MPEVVAEIVAWGQRDRAFGREGRATSSIRLPCPAAEPAAYSRHDAGRHSRRRPVPIGAGLRRVGNF